MLDGRGCRPNDGLPHRIEGSVNNHLELVATLAPPSDPLIGRTVDGRYRIERRLGEGGMGVVYQCTHVVLGKPLAMKVLRSDVSKNDETIKRFRQEAQSASAIGSQHIIDISDFGALPEGSTYFVMEFLDGRALTDVIEADGLTDERVIHIARQLCDGLGAAHDRGIVHRDLKPDNVFLVNRQNNADFVKVLDFGIAKVGGASSKLTRAGQVFGTPHYMSPEQCAGQAVDHRTDIYALGVIMYEMACGKVPFDADNLMGILTKHIYENPIPPHQLPPPVNVSPGLEAVILKSLAKQADQRYQSMAEVKADLDRLSAGETPGAVMDAVNRSSAPGLGDASEDRARLGVGVGGVVREDAGGKLPIVLGGAFGLLALVAVAAVVYFLVLAPEETAEVPIAVVETPGPEPEPVVEEPVVEPEEAASEVVMLSITSDPPGVEVWFSAGGVDTLAGNTPFEIARPPETELVELVLKQAGFVDHPVRVGHSTQPEVLVTMRAVRPSGRRSRESRGSTETTGTSGTGSQATPPEDPPRRRDTMGSEVLDPWSR